MYYERVLPNGITVVGQQLPGFRSVSTGIWVHTGSNDENDRERGISHFIEHMLFKGTSRRSAKQIAAEMDAIGGILNAFTSKECTCYHARITSEHIREAMDILCDLVFHSNLAEEDIAKEKGVVLEEINMVEDSPDDLVFELMSEAYFKGSNLSYPILGTAESLRAFTRDDLISYMQRRYTPECMVFAIAGGFDFDEYCDIVEELTRDIAGSAATCTVTDSMPCERGSFLYREKPIEQAHLCLALPGVHMTDDRLYPITIFNNVFGGSMSSRLFQVIREEMGIAYDVYSQPSAYSMCGMFSIYAGLNAEQAENALHAILNVMDDVRRNGITQEEFVRGKEQLKGNYTLGLESASSRMNAIGKSRLLTGSVRTAEETLQQISAVTFDDVAEVLPMVLDLTKMSAAAVGKIKPKKLLGILGI